MVGCDWDKKSFTVPMQGKTHAICRCGKEIETTVYKYNGDYVCNECFSNIPSKIKSRIDGNFLTTKDGLYNFVEHWGDKTYEIRTKGQWKKFMKERGLHDDIKQTPRKPSEYLKAEDKKTDRRWIADQIGKELREKGLADKLIRRRR